MAKRYGRNQRRRHREEIANLTVDIQRHIQIASNAVNQYDELYRRVRDWDDDIRLLLGGYSAFLFETARVKTDEPVSRVPVGGTFDRPAPLPNAILEDVKYEPFAVVSLRRLVINFMDDRYRLKAIVRLTVERTDGRQDVHFAYSIGRHDLIVLGRRDLRVMAERVSKELYDFASSRGLNG